MNSDITINQSFKWCYDIGFDVVSCGRNSPTLKKEMLLSQSKSNSEPLRQTDRQPDRQTDRQTNKQTNKQSRSACRLLFVCFLTGVGLGLTTETIPSPETLAIYQPTRRHISGSNTLHTHHHQRFNSQKSIRLDLPIALPSVTPPPRPNKFSYAPSESTCLLGSSSCGSSVSTTARERSDWWHPDCIGLAAQRIRLNGLRNKAATSAVEMQR
jgi:hypothetical protein